MALSNGVEITSEPDSSNSPGGSKSSNFVDSMKPSSTGSQGQGQTQKPYFDDVGPRNVTAVVGQSAMLKCRVKHPGERTRSRCPIDNEGWKGCSNLIYSYG
ncbi:unnamed protein product [Acanthoscelides obtectus]|uniref:Uncharacterized protein n=1 Tax=Acanthoscelides obtectus TaxID=200917 RepID=A0A9P0MAF6_ACAOB|nr:unnamed protein product [Acanthoscelides obtectus]CAK1665048.1 hypothetical protein AOBTE_LOCUS24629 [Acanthoscelides obtectus]